jgi:hypothetical protein
MRLRDCPKLSEVPDPRARRGVRHRLTVVVTAAVCAVVAGCRSYTAIAEWVADLPQQTASRWVSTRGGGRPR